jgi:hypothetical protein
VQVIKFEQKPEVKTEQTSLQNQTPQAQPVAQQQKSSLSLKEKFSKKGR